jgi:hypothetical protein
MYETGELGPRQIGDPPVYLVEGHRVHTDPHEDMSVPNNAMKWCEVCCFFLHPTITYLSYWNKLTVFLDFRLSTVMQQQAAQEISYNPVRYLQ